MSISIGKYIKYKLSGIVSIINPLAKPEDETKPFIVYKRKYVQPEYTRDGIAFNLTGIQIDVVSTDYSSSIDLAEQVRSALECKSGAYSGVSVTQCELTGVDENYDGNLYIQTLVFEFKTN
jgi:hypothetical protein